MGYVRHIHQAYELKSYSKVICVGFAVIIHLSNKYLYCCKARLFRIHFKAYSFVGCAEELRMWPLSSHQVQQH